jgi:hypothetical protein
LASVRLRIILSGLRTTNSFLGFSSFHRLDLVSTVSTPWVVVVLAYLLSRRRLAGGEALSSSVSGAPDCRQNRQNWTIRFAKPDSPVSVASSRSFRSLFISCGLISLDQVAGSLSNNQSRAPPRCNSEGQNRHQQKHHLVPYFSIGHQCLGCGGLR